MKTNAPEGGSALQKAMSNEGLARSEDMRAVEVSISMENMAEAMCTDVTDDELKYDWWSKYYASVGEDSKVQEGYVEESQDKLVEYKHELEKSFNNFSDLAHTFPLFRGKGQQSVEDTNSCLLYTSPSPRDRTRSRMPSSA